MIPADVAAVPNVLSNQNHKPAQRPCIVVEKTSRAGRLKELVSILKGKAKTVDKTGYSRD